jgi:hypothetical protein
MNNVVLNIITEVVVPIAIAGLSLIGGHVLLLLKTKLKNEQVKMALDQLAKITLSVVQDLNQTMVYKIKQERSLTDEDKKNVKEKAIAMIKLQMQDEFLKLLDDNTISADARIKTEIESQVFEINQMTE